MNESDFPAPLPHDPTGRGSRAARAATTAALVVLIIGGFNWALVGLFNMDFIAALYALTLLPRLAYEPG